MEHLVGVSKQSFLFPALFPFQSTHIGIVFSELNLRSSDGVTPTIHVILRWLGDQARKPVAYVRQRALEACVHCLKCYAKHTASIRSAEGEQSLQDVSRQFTEGLGQHVGLFAARCTDPELGVRVAAADALYLLYRIDFYLREGPGTALPKSLVTIQTLKLRDSCLASFFFFACVR